ncbi:hypothetical protein E2562_004760 [Oryza meyeriana var. granulata]|uniref:KIB1-4 beta-propeller domain-containing protein n=1 Tax=Oryza meyeriana var. granulata TaxID=110450 RepID=A0A6G1DE58_9ORYZ|nr:hypothetical protein E2562_004760 [Oryza meyeriana var. granulata]
MQSVPPPLPWLALRDGTFLNIATGVIHPMTLPDDACCHGSLDNWLFLMKSDGGCSLMNPFSRAKLKLPKLATYNAASRFKPLLYKLVVPLPLDSSPDSLVTVLSMDEGDGREEIPLSPPWPDLQPELLGLVLLRLPSHADRVRLRAVCRPWRSSASLLQLPPQLPWLVLRDGAFLTLADGAVHRLSVPGDVGHLVSTGSDLLLLSHDDGMLSLMNPSSSTTAPLPDLSGALREEIELKYLAQRPVSPVNQAVVSDHLTAFLISGGKVIITTEEPHAVAEWSPACS